MTGCKYVTKPSSGTKDTNMVLLYKSRLDSFGAASIPDPNMATVCVFDIFLFLFPTAMMQASKRFATMRY